jgi:hypothetical protein
MSIDRLYDKTFTVRRLTTDPDDEDGIMQSYEAGSSYPCHIQQNTDSETQDIPGSVGLEYILFTQPDANLEKGDHISIDGIVYRVMGVDHLDFLAVNKHIEARIRIFKDEN